MLHFDFIGAVNYYNGAEGGVIEIATHEKMDAKSKVVPVYSRIVVPGTALNTEIAVREQLSRMKGFVNVKTPAPAKGLVVRYKLPKAAPGMVLCVLVCAKENVAMPENVPTTFARAKLRNVINDNAEIDKWLLEVGRAIPSDAEQDAYDKEEAAKEKGGSVNAGKLQTA